MLRKKIQGNFTIADNRIMQLQGLSFEARGLYFYMLSLPDGWGFSEARLAKNGGIGLDKCKRILKELFNIGLIKREFCRNEKGNKKSVYTLYDFSTLENPTLENPTLENPTLENPTLENPTYNKELNINNNINNNIINSNITENINITEDSNILNNKRDLEKEKKEKYKKEKKKKTIFDEALELYPQDEKLSFSYDDWKEWVEYKTSIGKNLTILTFKKNLKQLIDFGDLAKVAMDTSISNNWVGLFPPHQKVAPNVINATNRNFKGGGLSARDKFANMDNPEYDDSVYDFSLLPSEGNINAK